MSVAIFDDADEEVLPEIIGEVVTRGENFMRGYYKEPALTEEVSRAGWYHTGDLGYTDHEGFLYIVDRKKDMIIRGGQNIYPAEIENLLYEHPRVGECAVIGVPDPILGETAAAIIVPKPQPLLSAPDLSSFLAGRLAHYKLPVQYHFVQGLPHNASGKILKRELRMLARAGTL